MSSAYLIVTSAKYRPKDHRRECASQLRPRADCHLVESTSRLSLIKTSNREIQVLSGWTKNGCWNLTAAQSDPCRWSSHSMLQLFSFSFFSNSQFEIHQFNEMYRWPMNRSLESVCLRVWLENSVCMRRTRQGKMPCRILNPRLPWQPK